MTRARTHFMVMLVMAFATIWTLVPVMVRAHCDTMDGPVVNTAKSALEKGDVTPVLKWVKKENEADIRTAFAKTLAVRKKGPEAKELADNYFFETLVRVHRAGEGAPYTGLKPAGTEVDPAVLAADKSLETGRMDEVVKQVQNAVEKGIQERFNAVQEKKKHSDDSVEAGREYVAAYVEFVHYVERLHLDATGNAAHESEAEGHQSTGEHVE